MPSVLVLVERVLAWPARLLSSDKRRLHHLYPGTYSVRLRCRWMLKDWMQKLVLLPEEYPCFIDPCTQRVAEDEMN
jgi:hypothetical protein